MKIEPIPPNQPTFGILQGYRKTSYGNYMWGVYKGNKIDIYDAYIHKQKLIYVSDNKFLKWVKSKLTYFENGTKKVIRSEGK